MRQELNISLVLWYLFCSFSPHFFLPKKCTGCWSSFGKNIYIIAIFSKTIEIRFATTKKYNISNHSAKQNSHPLTRHGRVNGYLSVLSVVQGFSIIVEDCQSHQLDWDVDDFPVQLTTYAPAIFNLCQYS